MVVELGNRNRKLEISTVPKKRSRGNPLSQAQAVSLFQFTLFRVFCSQCKTLFFQIAYPPEDGSLSGPIFSILIRL